MDKLQTVVFYTIEKAIKSYRQFAQQQLRRAGLNITIDQWLIMKSLIDTPDISQQEIAGKVFKDNASVTRIIDLLVKSKYIKRTANKEDKRRSHLSITAEGQTVADKVAKVVLNNRATALEGISEKDIEQVNNTLQLIISNCAQ
jgi:MarR family transcriptional regulator, transcriptional regulator for hemolysin